MQKKDYENILIKKTGFYIADYPYASILKKYNITTVGQILDKELMTSVIGKVINLETQRELMGLIKLIEYKYLGKSLPNDNILSKKIKSFSSTEKDILFHFDDEKINCDDLFKAILLEIDVPGFIISTVILNDEEQTKAINSSILTVADLLDLILNSNGFNEMLKYSKCRIIKNILEASIESYDKKNGIVREKKSNNINNIAVNAAKLKKLKNRVTEVIKLLEELDIKTDELTIEELRNKLEEQEGNIRR